MYASNMEVRDEVWASLGSRTIEAARAVVIQIGPDQTETDQPSARNRWFRESSYRHLVRVVANEEHAFLDRAVLFACP
jgi:hypothetical protein